jgi:hypothetical protein
MGMSCVRAPDAGIIVCPDLRSSEPWFHALVLWIVICTALLPVI